MVLQHLLRNPKIHASFCLNIRYPFRMIGRIGGMTSQKHLEDIDKVHSRCCRPRKKSLASANFYFACFVESAGLGTGHVPSAMIGSCVKHRAMSTVVKKIQISSNRRWQWKGGIMTSQVNVSKHGRISIALFLFPQKRMKPSSDAPNDQRITIPKGFVKTNLKVASSTRAPRNCKPQIIATIPRDFLEI